MRNRSVKHVFISTFCVALCLSFSSCIFSPFNVMDLTILSSGLTNSGAEALTDQETGLFDDGPADLPVTIAKLDSPDATKIEVSLEALSSPDQSAPPPELAATEQNYLLTVTGLSGAVASPNATPYVVAYVMKDFLVDETTETISPVAADGTFEFAFEVTPDEQVIFAAMAADQETTSPFTTIYVDTEILRDSGTGTFTFVTTNSDSLDPTLPIFTDLFGYYYMSVLDESGGGSLVRRNLDGSPLQTVLEDTGDPIDFLAVTTNGKVAYVDRSGVLQVVIPPTGTTASLVEATPVDLSSYHKTIATLESYDPEQIHVAITLDESSVIVSQNGADLKTVRTFRMTSDYEATLVPAGVFDDLFVVLAKKLNVLLLSGRSEGRFGIYSLNLDDPPSRAWQDRGTIYESNLVSQILGASGSEDGNMVVEAELAGGSRILLFYDISNDELTQLESGVADGTLTNPKLSDDGEIILACRIPDAAGEGNQIFFMRTATPETGFQALTADPNYNVCTDDPRSYTKDTFGFVHFYRSLADGSSPQHAFINLNALVE